MKHFEGNIYQSHTFEKYVESHYFAFLELERNEEPIVEVKNIKNSFIEFIHQNCKL